MGFYWTIAIITIIINLIPANKQKNYLLRLKISLIPLFLYSAFRVNFGLDYDSYLDFFNGSKIYGLDANNRMELGYYYLNLIMPSFRSLLIFQSLLMCTAFYYLFKWYIPANYTWIGFVLLFLSVDTSIFFILDGIRNGMAISILILTTFFVLERKIIPMLLLMFMAYMMHESALLVAPVVYFLANGKPVTKSSIIIWMSIMFFFAVASSTIVLDYADVFFNKYFDRYSTYIVAAKEYDKGAGILVSVFSIVVSAIFIFLLKDKKLTTKESSVVKFTLIFFLSYLLGPLNVRVSQYFAPFFIAGSIVALYKGTNKPLKIAYFIAIFAFLFYSMLLWFDKPNFPFQIYNSTLFN